MTRNKATKAVIAVLVAVALVVGGEGARRPRITTRTEAAATVVL